jgi:hypothetical protein
MGVVLDGPLSGLVINDEAGLLLLFSLHLRLELLDGAFLDEDLPF